MFFLSSYLEGRQEILLALSLYQGGPGSRNNMVVGYIVSGWHKGTEIDSFRLCGSALKYQNNKMNNRH